MIFTMVSWLPRPAKLNNAETLIFFGNSLTASLAVPSNIVEASFISLRFILKSSKNFAPLRELGCFVVFNTIESNSC